MVKISILSNHKSYLREEQRWCIAKVLGLEEEVQITWKHDYISIGETDRKMLNQSIMCLTKIGYLK